MIEIIIISDPGIVAGDYITVGNTHLRVISRDGCALRVERTWRCVWFDFCARVLDAWSRIGGLL